MIRRARVRDAAALADINRRGWLLAYAHIVPAETMRAPAVDLETRWADALASGREVLVATDGPARRFYERNGWSAEPGSGPGPWGWAPSVRYRKGLAP